MRASEFNLLKEYELYPKPEEDESSNYEKIIGYGNSLINETKLSVEGLDALTTLSTGEYIKRFPYRVIKGIMTADREGLLSELNLSSRLNNSFTVSELTREGKISIRKILLYAAKNNIDWKKIIEKSELYNLKRHQTDFEHLTAYWHELSPEEQEKAKTELGEPFLKAVTYYEKYHK